MKITKLFLIGIAALLFSCSEDEDPVPTSERMVGAWSLTAIDYKGTSTTTGSGVSLKADFTGTGKDYNYTTTFAANPNTVVNNGSYTIVLTTKLAGQSQTEEYEVEDISSDGSWTLSGKTLTMISDDETQAATITEQSATTLKLKIEYNETETDMGITVATKMTATMTYKKK